MRTLNEITNGTRIESNKMTMVVTGENEKSYFGYHEYKGRAVGQCSLSKDIFTNPHYVKNIKVIN